MCARGPGSGTSHVPVAVVGGDERCRGAVVQANRQSCPVEGPVIDQSMHVGVCQCSCPVGASKRGKRRGQTMQCLGLFGQTGGDEVSAPICPDGIWGVECHRGEWADSTRCLSALLKASNPAWVFFSVPLNRATRSPEKRSPWTR